MSDSTVIERSDSFYDLFKKDYLPSFDFFRLFLSKLSLKGITMLDSKKLMDFLLKMKTNHHEYDKLLSDIHFYFNGIKYVSKDIEPNINSIQELGSIGISNPRYENILNYIGNDLADKIIEEYPSYNELMDSFVNEFLSNRTFLHDTL
jgi:hypothetical protein